MSGSVPPFSSRIVDRVIGDPGKVALVALTEGDLPDIDRLLREAEVAAWWPDPDIEEKREFLTHNYVSPFRIVAANATIGYAHAFHANRDEFWASFGVPSETFGMDIAIGEASARNRGVGRVAARLLVARLFAWPQVVRVQIDPYPPNERAVRSYRGAGFVERGVYPGYDGDTMLYMTIER
jgi:RimJ/RimL family protein N-acetyltransferase